MQRNTATTFENLRPGDRFRFPEDKKKKAFQVTVKANDARGWYNDVLLGLRTWKYDKSAKAAREVIFIRHTMLEPNDTAMLYDLEAGNVFLFLTDTATEFAVIETQNPDPFAKCIVKAVCIDAPAFAHTNTEVIYLRTLSSLTDDWLYRIWSC